MQLIRNGSRLGYRGHLKIYFRCTAQGKHMQKKVSDALLHSMRGSRGTGLPDPHPPPRKILKVPSWSIIASNMPFKWRFAGGPIRCIWILSTLQLKNAVRVGASVSRSVREVKGHVYRIFLLHKDVHFLETSFQASCVNVIARGQSSPLHMSCDM